MVHKVRSSHFAAVIALVVFAIAALPALASTRAGTIEDNDYAPTTLNVAVGDTVQWTDTGSNPHSVTGNTGQTETFDSSPSCSSTATTNCLKKTDTFQHTFTHTGTFTYYCRIHGTPNSATCSMCGTIVVAAASTATPTATVTATATPTPTPTPAATIAPSTTAPPAPASSLPRSGSASQTLGLTALTLLEAGVGLVLLAGWMVARRGRSSSSTP